MCPLAVGPHPRPLSRVRERGVRAQRGRGEGERVITMSKKRPLRAPAKIRLRARELRQQMTPAEAALWERLRRKQLGGLKFRRQHPIGRFIVDFYCPSARLIVEVDGKIHDYQKRQDAARDAFLTQRGYRVLRFRNEAVLQNIEMVLDEIKAKSLSSSPSPSVGEGSPSEARTG